MPVSKIPPGFHTITPSLIVRDAAKAIDFYKKALGAEERMRMASPDGKIGHAELKIGDSIIFLSEESQQMGTKSPQTLGGTSSYLYLYVEDVDAVYERALKAGAESVMALADQFYGDRSGGIKDPSGNIWYIATHKEDVAPDELKRRAEAAMIQGGQH